VSLAESRCVVNRRVSPRLRPETKTTKNWQIFPSKRAGTQSSLPPKFLAFYRASYVSGCVHPVHPRSPVAQWRIRWSARSWKPRWHSFAQKVKFRPGFDPKRSGVFPSSCEVAQVDSVKTICWPSMKLPILSESKASAREKWIEKSYTKIDPTMPRKYRCPSLSTHFWISHF